MPHTLYHDNRGGLHVVAVAIVVLVGVIGFTAGVLYRVQQANQQAQEVAISTEPLVGLENGEILEGFQIIPLEEKDEPEPEESKEEAPARDTQSKESTQSTTKPEPKPTATKPKESSEPKKQDKDPEIIKLQNVSVSANNGSFVFRADIPGSISGTCQALLKPADGAGSSDDHKVVSSSTSGSSCSVKVEASSLNQAHDSWQTYMSFYSSDKSVKSHWQRTDNIKLD